MPRSRSKQQRKRGRKPKQRPRSIPWGGSTRGTRDRLWTYGLIALGAAVVAAGGLWWWQSAQAERDFLALAAEGEGALARVESLPSKGRSHLEAGQRYVYQSRFPTSGPHAPVWTEAGVYDDPQPRTQLVHAIEHGNIVVYYDQPGAEAMATLRRWADLYDGKWSGLVIVPAPGLGRSVVLTAWTERLTLETFDAAPAAAFIDAYRGRGPEHPVR